MKTRTWVLLICSLFVLCLGLSIALLFTGEAATHAEIYSQGQLLRTVDLRIDQEFTVTTPSGGSNTITVRDGHIAVTQANCPDHYCIQRGFCSSGTQIVCLPNRLVIRFAGRQEIDGVVG